MSWFWRRGVKSLLEDLKCNDQLRRELAAEEIKTFAMKKRNRKKLVKHLPTIEAIYDEKDDSAMMYIIVVLLNDLYGHSEFEANDEIVLAFKDDVRWESVEIKIEDPDLPQMSEERSLILHEDSPKESISPFDEIRYDSPSIEPEVSSNDSGFFSGDSGNNDGYSGGDYGGGSDSGGFSGSSDF